MARVRGVGPPTHLNINGIDFPDNVRLSVDEPPEDGTTIRSWYNSPRGSVMTASNQPPEQITTESLRNAVEELGERYPELQYENYRPFLSWRDRQERLLNSEGRVGVVRQGDVNHRYFIDEMCDNGLVRRRYPDGTSVDAADLPTEENPEEKAIQLLKEHLTQEQWDFLEVNGYLEVPSSLYASCTYRIPRHYRDTFDMVELWEHDERKELLCVQPQTTIPDADKVLMHKLLIETDEAGYLGVAKRWCPRTHRELGIPEQHTVPISDVRIRAENVSFLRSWRVMIPVLPPMVWASDEFYNAASMFEMRDAEVEFEVHRRGMTFLFQARVVGHYHRDFPDVISAWIEIGDTSSQEVQDYELEFAIQRFQREAIAQIRSRLEE